MSGIVSSEENRKNYINRKEHVLQLLKETEQFYKNEDQEKSQIFAKLYSDLENGEFSIVVVGEFSAGKSTLLNALMGKRILPSFSNETTATVNFLRHKSKALDGEAGRVYYNDNTQKIINDASLDTIMEYVSTKGKNVAKTVDHLDLYLDSDFLMDGVTLVDTPGLNGVADGHREITEAQILKSHACIFLFNSDHPGSKTDFDFLYELQKKVKTIIFVLNKIDEIKPDEGETPETVIETLKHTYKEKFPEETSVPEIWPVAAYPALVARSNEPLEYHDRIHRTLAQKQELELNSRLQEFENRLMSFLVCGEKTKQQLLSPVERVIALCLQSRTEWNEEKAILENSADTVELENQIANIQEIIDNLEKRILENRRDIQTSVKQGFNEIIEEFSAEMSKLQERQIQQIDYFDEFDELMHYLNSFEDKFIQKVSKIAIDTDENIRERILITIETQYSAQVQNIENAFDHVNFNFSLSVSQHLEKHDRIFEVGLKDMEEKTNQLDDELHKLTEESKKAEEDYYEARKIERKMEELKDQKKTLEERKNTIESEIIPPIESYYEDEWVDENRKGVVGVIAQVLIGKKSTLKPIHKTDATAHNEAIEERDKKVASVTDEIKENDKEIASLKDVDSVRTESRYLDKKSEVESVRQQLKQLMEENTQKIEEKYQREIRNLKRELTDYCDDITGELNFTVKKKLRGLRKQYTDIIVEVVGASLKSELEDKKNRIKQIEKQMKNSEANKNLRISELENKIGAINKLIENASDLKVNLESMEVDQIKREAL